MYFEAMMRTALTFVFIALQTLTTAAFADGPMDTMGQQRHATDGSAEDGRRSKRCEDHKSESLFGVWWRFCPDRRILHLHAGRGRRSHRRRFRSKPLKYIELSERMNK